MPGSWVQLRYERSPSFLDARLDPNEEVLIGRFPGQGPIAAMAVRCPRQVYCNGQPRQVGYLSALRVAPAYQGGTMLWRGYHLLRQLDQQQPLDEHLATIVDGNELARQLLVERARPSWPHFRRYATLFTLALAVGRRYSLGGLQLDDQAPLRAFQEWGPQRQFFPTAPDPAPWEQRQWLTSDQGVAALRDLSPGRQMVVHAYGSRLLAALRPLYNLGQRLRHGPQLPAPGAPLKGAYAGYVLLDGVRPATFGRLLEGLLELARQRGKSWLYLGLLETDPHLPMALTYPHTLYRSQLYRLNWAESPLLDLDDRPGYLELATL